jgi:subtilisin-like proprotein convertase family protein
MASARHSAGVRAAGIAWTLVLGLAAALVDVSAERPPQAETKKRIATALPDGAIPADLTGSATMTTVSSGPVAVPILDNSTATSTLNTNSLSGLVQDVNVRVRLDHTFDNDLRLLLTSPDGVTVPLALNAGGIADHYGSGPQNCTGTFAQFDDEATTRIEFGAPPFAGVFRPTRTLAALDGTRAAGIWTLSIIDQANGDIGTLFCWELTLTRTTPPAHEFADPRSDLSVYRPSTSQWFIRTLDNPFFAYDVIGQNGDIPATGQYIPNAALNQRALFRPSTGQWIFDVASGLSSFVWGTNGDIPVPGDYNADGTTDAAVYRPSTGVWHVRNVWNLAYGAPGDIPVPANYLPGPVTTIAVWRPSTGAWYVAGATSNPTVWGASGDIPVPGDYFGDERAEIAVFRPSNGFWYMRGWDGEIRLAQYGLDGDIPVPADYDGDGKHDFAIYRPSEGRWYIQNIGVVQFGTAGDIPILKRPAYPGYPY